jgi:hypothetical protein
MGQNRGLSKVVKQIVGEHLDRRYRRKREHDARADEAEQVGKFELAPPAISKRIFVHLRSPSMLSIMPSLFG